MGAGAAREQNVIFVTVGGLRLRVAIRGSGPPLLLITGLGANIEMWAPFERLLHGRSTISFDAPGMGESESLRRPVRLPGLAQRVVELIGSLGYERVDVLGYSLGGAIAQELARRAPERVDRLLLCGTGPGIGSLPPRHFLVPLVLATPYRYYDPLHYERVIPRVVGGRTARDKTLLRQQAEAHAASPPSWIGYAYQMYAAWGWTSLPWLHRLKQPTLVVAGEDDPIIPVLNARMLAWRIPNARLHVVRGGGHLFLIDQPETVVDVIQQFLDETPSVGETPSAVAPPGDPRQDTAA